MNTLRTHDLPSRGIHLHAYNGPVELIPELVELGAYFSFAAKQLEFNSEKVEDRIRAVPIQRLLIETDATYRNDFTTLHNCYTAIAEIREMSLEKLSESVAENFKSYFLTHYC
ncbi:MAG: TatD DNase family protein [Zhongshania aliphaticivorans]|jgi:TatD DNase family protein